MTSDEPTHASESTDDDRTETGSSRRSPINRRSVLKKIGTAGIVGTLGVPATVSAATSDTHVKKILESPQVTRIREKIGAFTVKKATVRQIQKKGKTITLTEIETDLGTLSNTDSGSTVGAEFELDLSNNPALHQQLPAGFGPIPAESTVSLFSDQSSSAFVRMVTDDERAQLEQAVGENVIAAAYTSKISGFAVAAGTVSEERTDIQRYRVGANEGDISAASVEPVFSARGCWATCIACGAAAVGAGFCGSQCAAVTIGVGIPGCIACVAAAETGLIISCNQCYECLF